LGRLEMIAAMDEPAFGAAGQGARVLLSRLLNGSGAAFIQREAA